MQILYPSVGSNTELNNLVKLKSGNFLSSGFKIIFDGKISVELIFCYNFGKLKLDAIVDFSGVDQFLDTPVKRYSSGMHVRLGFAVAAHLEPDILIVDDDDTVIDDEDTEVGAGRGVGVGVVE